MSNESKKIIWKIVRQVLVVILSAITGAAGTSCALSGSALSVFGL